MRVKLNAYGLRTINCLCRVNNKQEIKSTDVVEVKFFNRKIPGLCVYPWAQIWLKGKKVADCNAEFIKAQSKPVLEA